MKKFQHILMIITMLIFSIMWGIMWNFMPEYKCNLFQNFEQEASRILYKYILSGEDMSTEMIELARITPETVRAFEYDLNDDGVNEIIGTCYSTYYFGVITGYHLFILQLQNNKRYKDISNVDFLPSTDNINILKNIKNNKFNRLFLTKKYVCGFNNKTGYYEYLYNIDIVSLIRHYIWLYSIKTK